MKVFKCNVSTVTGLRDLLGFSSISDGIDAWAVKVKYLSVGATFQFLKSFFCLNQRKGLDYSADDPFR